MTFELALPAFIAGVLMFLAPCTLPLVPAYLGFISGVSLKELVDKKDIVRLRAKIILNGILFVVGFSFVFILLGGAFGLVGSSLLKYRQLLSKIGGALVIFFGLYFLGLFKLKIFSFMKRDYRFTVTGSLKPGEPVSSLLFGATFAFGWSPCIGPVLGSILLLASTAATAGAGGFLLFIFSLGFSVPFLLLAVTVGQAAKYLKPIEKHLDQFSMIAGIFLILIGALLFFDQFEIWTAFFYRLFDFINYDALLNYL